MFANIYEPASAPQFPKFRKTEYLELSEGEHTIRFLESQAKDYFAHFVGRSYVKCLGEGCPICENNRRIIYEDREGFRDNKMYKPRTQRFYVNVLDKTKARTCTACGTATKNLSLISCPACASALSEPAPLNKIKVLAKGKDLFLDLELIAKSTRNEQDEVVDIRTYDFVLLVKGSGKDGRTKISVNPRWFPGRESLEEVSEELFDLSGVLPELTESELLDVLNGTSIKDIYAVRRATKLAAKEIPAVAGDPVLMSDISAAVNSLFKE